MPRRLDTSIRDARAIQAQTDRDKINAYQRQRNREQARVRARRQRALKTTPHEHGASGYGNYGCRCNTCIEGHRDQVRRYRHNEPSPLALEVEQLKDQLEALSQDYELLREENTMLRSRLTELEP